MAGTTRCDELRQIGRCDPDDVQDPNVSEAPFGAQPIHGSRRDAELPRDLLHRQKLRVSARLAGPGSLGIPRLVWGQWGKIRPIRCSSPRSMQIAVGAIYNHCKWLRRRAPPLRRSRPRFHAECRRFEPGSPLTEKEIVAAHFAHTQVSKSDARTRTGIAGERIKGEQAAAGAAGPARLFVVGNPVVYLYWAWQSSRHGWMVLKHEL